MWWLTWASWTPIWATRPRPKASWCWGIHEVVLSPTWITEMILHLIQWTTCGPGRALAAHQGSLNPTPIMKRPRSCSRSSTLHSFTQPPRVCCLYNPDITCLMHSRDGCAHTHTHTVLIYRNNSSWWTLHTRTPTSAHLQDLPMKLQNEHDYNLVIAKQETDYQEIVPFCPGLPVRHACCCILFPGEELCLTARSSLWARVNSAAPRRSSSLTFWVWTIMVSMNLSSVLSSRVVSISAKTSMPTQCCL